MNKDRYHFYEFFIDEEIWNRQFGKLQVHGFLDLIRVLSELRLRRLMKLCLVIYEPFEDYVKQVELNNTCHMKMTHSTLFCGS